MEDKYEYIQKGVIAASYYYLIQHSKQNGVDEINFGSCRSFANDGVFCYKKKWGAEIDKMNDFCTQIYSFKPFNDKTGVKSFLENNPFVRMEKNQLKLEKNIKSS